MTLLFIFTSSPAAAWIFTQYYPKYVNEGLEVPNIVKVHTEEYWKNNDVYGNYNHHHYYTLLKLKNSQYKFIPQFMQIEIYETSRRKEFRIRRL